MVKTELLKNIADKVDGIKRADVDAVLNALEEVIEDAMKNGDKVTIPNIGIFTVRDVPERRGTIMMGEQKGKEYVIPGHKEPKFKMNKNFKKILA